MFLLLAVGRVTDITSDLNKKIDNFISKTDKMQISFNKDTIFIVNNNNF